MKSFHLLFLLFLSYLSHSLIFLSLFLKIIAHNPYQKEVYIQKLSTEHLGYRDCCNLELEDTLGPLDPEPLFYKGHPPRPPPLHIPLQ